MSTPGWQFNSVLLIAVIASNCSRMRDSFIMTLYNHLLYNDRWNNGAVLECIDLT